MITDVLTWIDSGVPHAERHRYVVAVDDDGRMESEVVFWVGRWPAGLLAEMAAVS